MGDFVIEDTFTVPVVTFWTSADETVKLFQTRKSVRIAQRDKSPTPTEPPKYVSKPYSVDELCEFVILWSSSVFL